MIAIIFKNFSGNIITINYAAIEYIQLIDNKNRLEVRTISGDYYNIQFKNLSAAIEAYDSLNYAIHNRSSTFSFIELQEKD
jgi:hypothetical protein